MCDSDNHQGYIADTSFTRRATLLTMSAAAVAAGLPATALAADVTETDVMVPTPDGKADAALFHPAGAGPWPAVLMWPDILGLRPVFRDMGRRLAAAGYTVLVPNPFYRVKRAPIVTGPFDFNNKDDLARVMAFKNGTDRRDDRQRRGGVRHLPRPAEADQSPQGRGSAGLLLQRTTRPPHRRGPLRPDPR